MRHNHGISSCSSRRTNASNSSREVLPFTPHAGKPGTIIRAPPSVSFAASSTIKSVAFRRVYDCGDLPAAVLHDSQGRKISWKTNPDTLDPTIYVPLFLDGLCETSKPYDVLSRSGSYDLIGRFCDRIPGFIQLVVSPIRQLALKYTTDLKEPSCNWNPRTNNPLLTEPSCNSNPVQLDLVYLNPRITETPCN
ncbi:hypothetical protein QYM36_009804 [Artemia franciscana]|uniref:Uncharacterized protein n=1 Tax=Artemia franciscana TaxID=6661 RepID=A0AA88HPM9_ARTSF|nr:hypothetical protein QYM36_009804 [Artemia franciscana]